MKTKHFLATLFLTVAFFSCSKSAKDFNSNFSLFKKYILNFSSGLVSASSDIRVVLAFDKPQWTANEELDEDLFSISPSVSGKVVALSSNTIAFIPDEKLDQNKTYQVTLHLSELTAVPDDLEDFNFTIKTIKQDFLVATKDLQSYSKSYQYLNGEVTSSDLLDVETLQKMMAATQEGSDIKIKFETAVKGAKSYKFTIDSIKRADTDTKLKLKWDGSKFDIDQNGEIELDIPGKNTFKIVSATVEDESQVLWLNFSDPIQKSQDFSGLVQVENAPNLRFATAGNVLKVFFDTPITEEVLVEVFQGIESEDGIKMKEQFSQKISFKQTKPAIRFVKSGSILPSSNNLKINFESINLSAVDVKIYQIYQNNILQFLQDNDLNGSNNLRNVALPIAKKTITLNANKLQNLSKWNAYAIDLSKIITPNPGAIYRVELSFKQKYSVYKCSTLPEEEEEETDEDEEVRSNRDYYYDSYYYDDYNWEEREDPCTKSYYFDKMIYTNIIASDLGVIAKRGENGSYFFAVNNIVTTATVTNAKIELYNFQQQLLGTATTNSEGIATIELKKYAYFAIVSKDNNTTYVKLDEGQSLSVSNFDVSGEALQKGLKGFIYGERGVWRPGDSLHLAFMLNDVESKLEKNHPITLKLADPQGKIRYQVVQKYNDLNHYKFKIATKDSDPTGNWEAKVAIGGVHFYKSIKIETVKPNRLKIHNSFADKQLSGTRLNGGEVQVAWLHGAMAKNVKVEMQAKFLEQKTTFKNYSKYDFDDEVRKFYTEELPVFSGQVNEFGTAKLAIQPTITSQAPGKLKLVFQTKAFEPGGDFSTDVATALYSPYKTYIGLKAPEPNKYGLLETDKVNQYEIVTVDEMGNPKQVRNLEIRVYKVEWRWWWNSNGDDLSRYNSSEVTTAYKNFVVHTDSNGKASFNFKVPEQDWGRYLIRVEDKNDGHATSLTSYIDWPYWSGKTRKGTSETANMLVFNTDKEKYAVNENAIVSFPSSEGGRALISIENGTKVIKTIWANTTKGETQVSIPLTAEMAPNVYVHITLLKPHAETSNDAPIRMYGILPIEVINKNTVLRPKVSIPEILKPEQKTTLTISEESGREMSYTIAIVDDGLLDLTRFKTPNPWQKFYARQALGVKTWDVYDDVIGAYGGKINQIFSIGGDQDLAGGNAKKANRFEPVVIYLGPFKLEKGQTKTHTITLPNYVGSVRTMVVAADAKNSAYGSVEKTSIVKKPVMVLASVPRKISSNEQIMLPVTVFAMENKIKNVVVQLKTNSGIRIVGSASQQVSFASPGEQVVYFKLETGSATGIGKIEINATSGIEKAKYAVDIDITNPNPITTDYVDVVLSPNSTKKINWKTFGISGSNKARLEIATFPTMNINGRLNYLVHYPHGCVEQTTSTVFAQLFLSDFMDLESNKKAEIQKNINAGIQKLGNSQLSNGGLTYWQGGNYAEDWATSYSGHFMMEAEKKGYVLPIGFKNKWVNYQQSEAKKWRFNATNRNDFPQAYRLYSLVVAGATDMGSMNRLRETPGISNDSKFRLAAAYALAGQKNAALALLNQIKNQETNTFSDYYGSETRNRAMKLETYLLVGNQTKAFELATKLAKEMSANNYMSTQTTAFSMVVLSKFAMKNNAKGIAVSLTSNGKTETISATKSVVDRPILSKSGSNFISLKNNQNATLYVRLSYSGILPVGEEKELEKNLNTVVSYKNRNGVALDLKSVKQGTEIIAEVTVHNTSGEEISNIALSQIVPSGFEIMNSRYTDFGSYAENKADYIDIRDDRTQFYFGLRSGESRTFTMLLTATYLGTYYFPGIQCEAMYDANYIARTKGQWVAIVKE